MSKAEEFIKAKTRIGSNTTKGWRRNGVSIPSYSLPWLTPDQARRAVEIAREEAIESIIFYIKNMVSDITFSDVDGNDNYDLNKFIEDLKQAMKDE